MYVVVLSTSILKVCHTLALHHCTLHHFSYILIFYILATLIIAMVFQMKSTAMRYGPCFSALKILFRTATVINNLYYKYFYIYVQVCHRHVPQYTGLLKVSYKIG